MSDDNKKDSEDLWATCIQCSKDFYIRPAEQAFYQAQNFIMPKRCWNCRKTRREAKDIALGRRAKPEKKDDKPAPVVVEDYSKSWKD